MLGQQGEHETPPERTYLNIADHALIGNLHTAALVSIDGSIESYCLPHFDSPSIFARILDKDKGGHFSITPCRGVKFMTKQAYLPSSNVLSTKFLSEEGVINVIDYMPRQAEENSHKAPLFWMIRRVEVIRGTMPIRVEVCPAFNYARDSHTTSIETDDSVPQFDGGGSQHKKVCFKSKTLDLDLRFIAGIADPISHPPPTPVPGQTQFAAATGQSRGGVSLQHSTSYGGEDVVTPPKVEFKTLDLGKKGHKGLGVVSELEMSEGQVVTFVLRVPPTSSGVNVSEPTPSPKEKEKGDSGAPCYEAPISSSAQAHAPALGGRQTSSSSSSHSSQSRSGPQSQSPRPDKNVHPSAVKPGSGLGSPGAGAGAAAAAAAASSSAGKPTTPSTKGSTLLQGVNMKEKAKELGVSVEDFVKGASRFRPRDDPLLTKELLDSLLKETNKYWTSWIRRSTYKGSYREAVHRSALALKLLIFEPTGAIIASPTFSLPEFIGGTRNWDYRASWIRDSSFTLYALIRLGFTAEAMSYMSFIFERLEGRNEDGSLQIMYTIHGGKNFPEMELDHLDGHKGSKPVRIGNGAIDHIQMDIYGELMDCIYLGQKFGKPLSYDTWTAVRQIVDYVVANYQKPDLSIWEVRNRERNFTYSKVMMWVAIDRGLRLAEKRSLPLLQRDKWTTARDTLYEEIMTKAWNSKKGFFAQSYEDLDVLDSAVLIMPLVFFMTPSDPRFTGTLKWIMKSKHRGGLTSNNLVYRYDVNKAEDGVGGEEGTFCLCTLWCVEALTRAGQYDPALLQKAVNMFEDFLQYGNHVHLFSEEISDAGEGLGNAVQGFTHVTLISAAYNLSRMLGGNAGEA